MMIMMLRTMVIRLTTIAKVTIMKSLMIRMIMMLMMVKILIRYWILKSFYIYTWRFFRFLPSFCYIFKIYSLTVQEIYYEQKKINSNVRTGFLCEWESYKYWWMAVTFEWTLSSFFKLLTICSFWSLLKILLVNHNGVFFLQNVWLEKKVD